jgi:hypothetical protein
MTAQQPASAPVPAQDTPGGPGWQQDAPEAPQTAPGGFPDIQGRCPACGGSSLFVGSGGYITCRRIECPEPDAATTLLERNPRTTPDNPATSSDTADNSLREQYAAAVECAIGLNVDCGGTEGVHRVRDAVLAVRDRELERLEKLHQAHLRVEARLAGESLAAEATADPIMLGKLEQAVAQPAELEPAKGGERP